MAIVAACTTFSLSAVVSKYRSAAACTPYSELLPNCAMFRYPCKISCFEYFFSICTEMSISRSLRAIVSSVAWYAAIGSLLSRALVASTFFTYCCVSDEPPCWSPLRM